MKNRFDGELGIMPLRFNKDTSSYVPQDTKKSALKSKQSKTINKEEDEKEDVKEEIGGGEEDDIDEDNPSKTGN